MGSIVFGMFLALVSADVLIGSVWEFTGWMFWRGHVRFRRRYSIGGPMPYFEYRDWMSARKGRSAWAA